MPALASYVLITFEKFASRVFDMSVLFHSGVAHARYDAANEMTSSLSVQRKCQMSRPLTVPAPTNPPPPLPMPPPTALTVTVRNVGSAVSGFAR